MFMPPSLAPLLLADLDEGGGGDGIAPGVVGDIMSLLPAFEEDFFADLEPLHILSKSVSSGTSTLSMVWRMPVHCKKNCHIVYVRKLFECSTRDKSGIGIIKTESRGEKLD